MSDKNPTADYKVIKMDIPGSEAISAAIASGDIKVRESAVLVKELKTKILFSDRVPVTLKGAAALVGGSIETFVGTGVDQVQERDEKKELVFDSEGFPEFARGASVVGLFYYGHNLTVRNYVRTKFLNETAAPEKKDEARIKMLLGLGYTREDAENLVKNAPGRSTEAPTEASATEAPAQA